MGATERILKSFRAFTSNQREFKNNRLTDSLPKHNIRIVTMTSSTNKNDRCSGHIARAAVRVEATSGGCGLERSLPPKTVLSAYSQWFRTRENMGIPGGGPTA